MFIMSCPRHRHIHSIYTCIHLYTFTYTLYKPYIDLYTPLYTLFTLYIHLYTRDMHLYTPYIHLHLIYTLYTPYIKRQCR